LASTGERRSAELTLPAQATSPARARRFLSATLAAWDLDGGDDALLVVSELATNALLHARTGMTVRVAQLADDTISVSVTDGGAAMPAPRRFSLDSGTGRGLRLLDTVGDAWGTDRLPGGGKVVWCRLRLGADRAYAAFDVEGVEAL
jgi:anti-sigma regulatory factor (Ser/Thr protein kinase)